MELVSRTMRTMVQAEVLSNVPIAKETFRLRFRSPSIARVIGPGQFVMIRPIGRTDPLLARPYALYDVFSTSGGAPDAIDIVYYVLGNGTRALRQLKPTDRVDVWGPLGNTFPMSLPGGAEAHLLIAAGGIGQTPFVAVCNHFAGKASYGGIPSGRARKITVTYGVRSEEYFAGIEDFEQTGARVRLSTDDGSRGHKGFLTDLVAEELASDDPPTTIFGCGPEPMLKRLASIASQHSVPCWVSLETKMACGYGVCFSCVCPVTEGEGWDYRRVCLEGSVFSARDIAWDVS